MKTRLKKVKQARKQNSPKFFDKLKNLTYEYLLYFPVTYLSKSRFRSSLLEIMRSFGKKQNTSISTKTDISKIDQQLKMKRS